MSRKRLSLTFWALALFAFSVLIRLFYWQIIQSNQLSQKAYQQSRSVNQTSPQRGTIYTSDSFPLAINQSLYRPALYLPNTTLSVPEIKQEIDQLIPDFSDQNKDVYQKILENPDKTWFEFQSLLTAQEKEKLENIAGLEFSLTQKRVYPEASMSAHLLGFVGKNSQSLDQGYSGLEGYYNQELTGSFGILQKTKDALGQIIFSKKSWGREVKNGKNLHLYLNRPAQFLAEEILKEGLETYQAESGSITIMESSTGHILAMASLPVFDPAAYSEATPSTLINPVISHFFEPGSIFKPLVMTMALDSSAVKENDRCPDCDRTRVISPHTINNWDFNFHPDSTMTQIIKNSDNIGMSFVIQELGLDRFLDYFEKLGFGQATGIDLQGEASQAIRTKKNWYPIDLASASFGQGISLTQIQMLTAFNTLANNGYLVTPQVAAAYSQSGQTIPFKTKKGQLVFGPKSIKNIKDMLQTAVDEGPLSTLKPEGYSVCAKSGTAQVAIRGYYDDSQFVASYIGFLPKENPYFTMLVTLKNPQTSSWGSSTAAPLWFDLAKKLIYLFDIKKQ
jgi:cell division protein FtsI/penicillin-binding protein 2